VRAGQAVRQLAGGANRSAPGGGLLFDPLAAAGLAAGFVAAGGASDLAVAGGSAGFAAGGLSAGVATAGASAGLAAPESCAAAVPTANIAARNGVIQRSIVGSESSRAAQRHFMPESALMRGL